MPDTRRKPWSQRKPMVVDRDDLQRIVRLVDDAGLVELIADREALDRLRDA